MVTELTNRQSGSCVEGNRYQEELGFLTSLKAGLENSVRKAGEARVNLHFSLFGPKIEVSVSSRKKCNPCRIRRGSSCKKQMAVSFVAGGNLSAVSAADSLGSNNNSSSADPAGVGSSLRPTTVQVISHPVSILGFLPKDVAFFLAGAVAGASAKTLTAPLDRVKLLLQVRSVQTAAADGTKAASMGLTEAFVKIAKEDGVLGFWKGNLPQVIRIIPYSAVQLFAYEFYKKTFQGSHKELSVPSRLAAGACAGMTSTLLTYPLDVLRLRMAVDPNSKQMLKVALAMIREEGALSFYKGLGPSLLSIAPYIALNFCAFDLIKKSIPEKYRKTPQASFVTALCATTFATVMCYPLDTVRRQLQMKNCPFNSVVDAFPGIIARDGVLGLYRGFLANALKNLPNSSIRLTTYDATKNLILSGQNEYKRLIEERKRHEGGSNDSTGVVNV